ncbi:MAG: BatC protein, partial [bacterium]|nr:BatC protein [bacterium]
MRSEGSPSGTGQDWDGVAVGAEAWTSGCRARGWEVPVGGGSVGGVPPVGSAQGPDGGALGAAVGGAAG